MGKRLELEGVKINFLTGVKYVRTNKRGQRIWLFKCDCGNTHEGVAGYVTFGCIKSCGCLQKTKAADHCRKLEGGPMKLEYGVASFHALYGSYKRNAKHANRGNFNLTQDQFKKLVDSICVYCGSAPHTRFLKSKNNGPYIYNGIDRVDNSIGYVLENCVTCCFECNRMKSNMSQQEFLAHIERIHNFQQTKSL